ncbi:alpha/beta hydrolase [Sphingosinicella sp. LHD-64]|uniref:alpha/beta hydrolase n=1 Tax=Sphingosinicella sp. LHD-64 TaxID=3072139 RepID=UPI00280C849B|nr:alpha/beta hydrolase [Sphingosinicella sp. LHD-64]MDQ8755434.1 alpha/beta hydrolase [Sphingosinicella sp. LHD-64]
MDASTLRPAPDAETLALLQGIEIITAGWRDRLLSGDIAASRAFASVIFRAFAGPPPAPGLCEISDLAVPGGDGERPARLYRPRGEAPQPVVLFLHGGGWSLGGIEDYDILVHDLATQSGVAFLSLDYRLAPEHGYPAALEDVAAALAWLRDAAPRFGLRTDRIGLMGDSAGGNLAAVTAWLERGSDPTIAGQWLIYPMTDVSRPHEDFPSRLVCGDGDLFLTRGAIDAARAWYLDQRTDLAVDPRVSPLNADPAGLPPTQIIVAGCDPLRDEGRDYHDRLAAAGVETSWRCYDSTIHAFLSFGVLDVAKAARAALAQDMRIRLSAEPDAVRDRDGSLRAGTQG